MNVIEFWYIFMYVMVVIVGVVYFYVVYIEREEVMYVIE